MATITALPMTVSYTNCGPTLKTKNKSGAYTLSGLHRADKSGRRHEYLNYSIQRARENTDWFYEWEPPTLSLNGSGGSSSQRPVPIGVGTVGRKLEVVRLGEVERPGPRRYVVEDLIPAGYPTLWHGDGGVAKSMLALSLGVSVAGDGAAWLGRVVEHTPARVAALSGRRTERTADGFVLPERGWARYAGGSTDGAPNVRGALRETPNR